MTRGRIHDETSVVTLGSEFCPEDRFEVMVRGERYGIKPTVAACHAIAQIFDPRLVVRQLLMGSIVIELPMDEGTGCSAIPKHRIAWMAKKFTWVLRQAGVLNEDFVSLRYPEDRGERPKPPSQLKTHTSMAMPVSASISDDNLRAELSP